MTQPTKNGWTRASPSLTKRVVRRIKLARSDTEKAYERNGFLSYHAETNAMGLGIAAGFYATALGETRILSFVYGAAVYGESHARSGKRRALMRDLKSEKRYAMLGLVVGAALGGCTRLIEEHTGVDVQTLLDLLPTILYAVHTAVIGYV